jgi:hypothetical protein
LSCSRRCPKRSRVPADHEDAWRATRRMPFPSTPRTGPRMALPKALRTQCGTTPTTRPRDLDDVGRRRRRAMASRADRRPSIWRSLRQPFVVHRRRRTAASGVSDGVSSAVTRRAPTFSARSFTRRRSPDTSALTPGTDGVRQSVETSGARSRQRRVSRCGAPTLRSSTPDRAQTDRPLTTTSSPHVRGGWTRGSRASTARPAPEDVDLTGTARFMFEAGEA